MLKSTLFLKEIKYFWKKTQEFLEKTDPQRCNGAMVASDFFSPQISILLLHMHRQQRYKYASVGEKMPILCREKI